MNNHPPELDFLKVIQLSDTHLFADDESDLFGVKTNAQFKQLIEHLGEKELHDTDLILLTGDLSQDETAASYEKMVAILDPLHIPIYWIPGNHDATPMAEQEFKKGSNFFHSRRLSTSHWNFIFLNTQWDSKPEGFLADEELQALEAELSKPGEKPITIVMHHHPLQVHTPLIDQHILRNHAEFWKIVSGTRTKLIMCGHVHEDYSLKHEDVTVETSPASCFQFPKATKEFAIDKKIGCKIYQFYETGFNTHTQWKI